MGSTKSCLCCKSSNKFDLIVGIKLPNSSSFLYSDNKTKKTWNTDDNINTLFSNIYKKFKATNYLYYNDQMKNHTNHLSSHCKGILSWNVNKFSWLIHSIPNFPESFDGININDIEHSQLIFGQSFIHMEGNIKFLEKIFEQLYNMNANVIFSTIDLNMNSALKSENIKNDMEMKLHFFNRNIIHLSKSHCFHVDIYEYIVNSYEGNRNGKGRGGGCYVESWLRGAGNVLQNTENITNIEKLTICNETHDHSKWAISKNKGEWVFIGDLNRMHSQMSRGGGGILIKNNKQLWKLFYGLIINP